MNDFIAGFLLEVGGAERLQVAVTNLLRGYARVSALSIAAARRRASLASL